MLYFSPSLSTRSHLWMNHDYPSLFSSLITLELICAKLCMKLLPEINTSNRSSPSSVDFTMILSSHREPPVWYKNATGCLNPIRPPWLFNVSSSAKARPSQTLYRLAGLSIIESSKYAFSKSTSLDFSFQKLKK